MYLPLDGPSLQGSQAVTDATPFRVRFGASEFKERDVVSLQPLDGDIWVYFGDNETVPTVANIQDRGFWHPKRSLRSYEASDTQEVYILAVTGTVDVRYAERG